MSSVINITRSDVQHVLDGSFSIPVEHWPPHMYHFRIEDCWDSWENEQFNEKIPECIKFWQRKVSRIRREMKLYKIRLTQPDYCNSNGESRFIYEFDDDALELMKSHK